MHIRRYSLAALIFMGLTFAYVYVMVTQQSVSIDVFGINLPQLPIALWVTLPMLLLYAASVVHMMYYTFVGSFKLRKYQKDYENLLSTIQDIYLNKAETKQEYKTERYQVLANALRNLKVAKTDRFVTSGHPKLDSIAEVIEDIYADKASDIKKLNLELDNPLRIQNDLNRLKEGKVNSEEILSKADRYSESVKAKAYAEFVKTSPLYAIQEHKKYLDKKSLVVVLKRINAKDYGYEASNEALMDLLSQVKMNEEELVSTSALLAKHMIPDQRIKLFELLSEENDAAMDAYLFTLYDVEMLDKAAEIIDNAQKDEFIAFRAYRSLREHNQNYNINLFTKKLCS